MRKDLTKAKNEKNDEFYTRYEDVEKELSHYAEQLKDKIIYCNCDDYTKSNFVKYFRDNFSTLHLKKLIATHYIQKNIFDDINVYKFEKTVDNEIVTELNGDGDYKSEECIEILKEVDIVITNPPFSIFRPYISTLLQYNKRFLIVGHQNAIGYKDIFPLIQEDKIRLGWGFDREVGYFYTVYQDYATASEHKDNMIRVSGVCWFTNLNVDKHRWVNLTEKYDPEKYKKFDTYDAINVDKTKDIPMDYKDEMGVPLTFMLKYNPEQFEIVGMDNLVVPKEKLVVGRLSVDGIGKYTRIIIKNKYNKKR